MTVKQIATQHQITTQKVLTPKTSLFCYAPCCIDDHNSSLYVAILLDAHIVTQRELKCIFYSY